MENLEIAQEIFSLAKELCFQANKSYEDAIHAWANIGLDNKARYMRMASELYVKQKIMTSVIPVGRVSALAKRLAENTGLKAWAELSEDTRARFVHSATLLLSNFDLVQI